MKKILLIALILFTTLAYSQKPKVSAVRYTDVTTTERDNYSVPTGEFWRIYNTTTTQNEYWDGDSWEALSISEAIFNLNSKNYSWGESYITNWRDLVLDDGATYFPNNGGYEKGRLHQLGLIPSLHFIPAAVKEAVLYSIGKNRTNDLTVDRNSIATYVDEDRIIQTAAIDVARIDYTDGDGAFLIEPQSINLYLNSEVMVTQDVTVTASEYTVSFYDTGTITFTGTHTGSLVGTGENDLVSITFTPSAGTLTSTISGTVTEGQIELGGYASSRIITAGTTVTRLADVITGAGDVNTFNSEEGVLYVEMAALADDGTNRQIGISDGTGDNRIRIRLSTVSNGLNVLVFNGSTQFNDTFILTDETDFFKGALKWKENDFALWVNGVEVLTDLSGTTFATNTLNVLDFATFLPENNLFAKVKSVQVFNRALSDDELKALTCKDGVSCLNVIPFLLIGFRRRNKFKIAA